MLNAERVRKLEEVVDRLRKLGTPDLAEQVRQVANDLRHEEQPVSPDLITTGDATELLGVRSINTIKRWAREGLLDGYRRGGRVLVTRASVQRMADAPAVADQRAFERDVTAALAPFDGPSGEGLEGQDLATSATWEGRKPWEHTHGTAR